MQQQVKAKLVHINPYSTARNTQSALPSLPLFLSLRDADNRLREYVQELSNWLYLIQSDYDLIVSEQL